ncbi:MAG: hypothetical protein ACLTXP_06045 [Odoribacter splanchnicus]
MKKYIVCSLCFWILCSSCNDWLDVKPQGQTEEEDMYTTYEGFKDALTGCYVKLKDRDLYGEGLTMSHIESLAQLWDLSGSTRDADLALARYEYENTYAKSVISGIYGGLYNVIVQANSVLRHLEHGGIVSRIPWLFGSCRERRLPFGLSVIWTCCGFSGRCLKIRYAR